MYKIIGGDGHEYGPVSADDVRRWIAEGRANAQTRVLAEGSTEWQALGTLPEFATSTLPGPVAPAPPGPVPAPTFIKVFSILNMVFGGLGLLCTPMNFIGIPMAVKTLGNSPVMFGYMVFSSVWGFIGACVLLASGIGLWKLRAWARKLAVWYSVLALVLGLAGMIIMVSAFWGMDSGNDMERAQRIGGIVGGVVGGLVGIAYNVLVLIFLTKAAAKKATGEMA